MAFYCAMLLFFKSTNTVTAIVHKTTLISHLHVIQEVINHLTLSKFPVMENVL